jgi:hypothetical protein
LIQRLLEILVEHINKLSKSCNQLIVGMDGLGYIAKRRVTELEYGAKQKKNK